MSDHCGVFETTVCACHEALFRGIAEGLYRAWSLPKLRCNDKSALGCSSGTSNDGENFSGMGSSSSQHGTVLLLIIFWDFL